MADADDLDELSSTQLHDLAVHRALRHVDIAFFVRLVKRLPVAEAAAGQTHEAEADVLTLRAHVDDVTDSGRGEVAELLRPFYLEYLRSHGVSAPKGHGED